MSWWRRRRRAHRHEGGSCPHCAKSNAVIASDLEERVMKALAGGDDEMIAFGLPCGCEKDIGEPVRYCKEHASRFN